MPVRRRSASAAGSGPGTIAAFLLDRGCYTTIAAPRAGALIYPSGINNRGQIPGGFVVDASGESQAHLLSPRPAVPVS
jgi:hypothetical protein